MKNTDPAFVRDLSDDKLEALIEMMFLAAAADGDLGEEEYAQFTRSAETLTSRTVTGERLKELVERARRALAASSREARFEELRRRLPDIPARKLALALAIQVTAADGIIRTSERELIMETAAALEIDGESAANMVRDLTQAS